MPRSSYIVTGGAGFIGSHLTERLIAEGHEVVVIDDLSTGSLDNLRHLQGHAKLQVITAKITEYNALDELAQDARFIFHLAAAVGVDLIVRSPINTLETNLRETERILEVAGRHAIPLLLASTSEVYGKSQKTAFTETDDLLIGPPYLGRWSYACSKLMDEFLALAFWKERHLPVVIARLFNTVGPRQTGHYGMVLPRFIDAAKANRPLRVFGDGTQSRCFCYVRDTVEALIRLQRTPDAVGEIVNIGSTEEVTILELANRVRRLLHSTSSVEFVPYHEAYAPGFEDMHRRKPSLEKLHLLTGFRPATSLDQIINFTAHP